MNQTSSVIPDTATAEELALGTDPIPAGPYFEETWFRDEVEAIFKKTWINIGHRCELPEKGSYIVRELEFANASLLIVRGDRRLHSSISQRLPSSRHSTGKRFSRGVALASLAVRTIDGPLITMAVCVPPPIFSVSM